MSTKELKEIELEISPLVLEAKKLVVSDDESLEKATTLLSKMNIIIDRVEEEKSKVLSPLKEAEKAERARWKPVELKYKGPIEYVRNIISDYQTEKVKAVKAEEAKIAGRMGDGKGKISLETAVKKIGEIEQPTKRVETVHGSISFRTDRVLKISDKSLIPHKFYIINEEAVENALKAGEVVPGAELDEIQVPINRRS